MFTQAEFLSPEKFVYILLTLPFSRKKLLKSATQFGNGQVHPVLCFKDIESGMYVTLGIGF